VDGDPFTVTAFNDVDFALKAAVADGTSASPFLGKTGTLFKIHFETCGATTAVAADFSCTVLDAADGTGKPLAGVTCSVN